MRKVYRNTENPRESWEPDAPSKGLEVGLRSMRNCQFDVHQKPTWKFAPEAPSEVVLGAWWPGAHFWWIWLDREFHQGATNMTMKVILSNVLSYFRCFEIGTHTPWFTMRALTCSLAWRVQWPTPAHRALSEEYEKMWKHTRRKSGTEKNVENMGKVFRNRMNSEESREIEKLE